MSAKNLVFGNIWFTEIFSEITEKECIKQRYSHLTANIRLVQHRALSQQQLSSWFDWGSGTQWIFLSSCIIFCWSFPAGHFCNGPARVIGDGAFCIAAHRVLESAVDFKANSAFHPSGVGKWVPASAGKAKAGMVHSVSGWTRGVQVKLWNPLRTSAIGLYLSALCVFTTRLYTNPRLLLPLPLPLFGAFDRFF